MEIGTIKQVDIQDEMQVAYLDYAMSVIVARALPDVRDGLKPVHRRILYAMQDMGLTSDKSYKKSARIVGEVLGKYHPHGDTAVYDAMVRMAQEFSLRYVLVDGQGNFGSIDGDNPAAMRYTEARLHSLANTLMTDLNKETVDFRPNFDDSLLEPSVLPAALPNLLVNGASGIAVGMATNVPPHNLNEVCDALAFVLDNYHRIDDLTVEDLTVFVKGPDFPTGGVLYRYNGDEDMVIKAYASGRGRFRVQALAHIEEMSRNRNRIVVTELPYQVNKTNLIERIADLTRDGKLEGITDLRDESDRTGMRIIIEVSRTADPRSVLADLYKYTPMQQTFGMRMLALVDGEPRMLSLKRVLQHYIEHRREVIRRRSEYDLRRARERAHILEGLLKALDILDEVIQTIRRSQTTETARNNLIRNFKFSEPQAQAILDMPLKRLAALERKRLQDEFDELMQRIAYLEDLLENPPKILYVIKEELLALKQQYGDKRRTRIVESGVTRESLTVRDMLADEPVIVGLTREGFLLRESMIDRRRGKLPSKIDDKAPIAIDSGSTHDELFIFASDGRFARVPVHLLTAGVETHVAELGMFRRTDRFVTVLALSRTTDEVGNEEYLVLATRDGRVKRVALADAWSAIGITTAMNVEDGDELIGAAVSDGTRDILLVSKLGQAIRFVETEVRPMGLPAAGVWGMKLSPGDEVVSLDVTRPGGELVIATTAGYFKRSPLDEYAVKGRHGAGVAALRLSQQSGAVADARVATPSDEFFSASRRGVLRKLDFQEIPSGRRTTTGRRLIQPAKNDNIATILQLTGGRSRSRRGGSSPEPAAAPPPPEPTQSGTRKTTATAAVKTTTPRKRSSATAKSTQTTTRTRAAASKKPSAGKATTAKSKPARSRAASKPADAADPAPEIIVKKSPSGKTRRVRTTPRTAKVTTRKPP
ncbi:MAG: DNA gyrase subunit A, partial [Anaerolineae bacterium]|nr:DNA gyrase subunit A [Anaerolineae bacterium]